jgi:hypothetical protein
MDMPKPAPPKDDPLQAAIAMAAAITLFFIMFPFWMSQFTQFRTPFLFSPIDASESPCARCDIRMSCRRVRAATKLILSRNV